MKGQWIGTYHGSTNGKLMINIDEMDDHFEGVAYVYPSEKSALASVAYLGTENKNNEQETTAYINPVNPKTGFQCTWDDVKHLYGEDVSYSREAKVSLKKINGELHVDAVSDIGVILKSILVRPADKEESKIIGQKMAWDDFKKHLSGISKSKYLFRGQKEPWRLRTSFHRRGRYRISNFISHDVRQLHQRLSAITSHFFDLTVPDQNGAFFNLLQHHGYPTPLLDWSYSPYVAAFFAFRDLPMKYSDEGHVRIYIFDNEAWQRRYPQILNLDPVFPHLSVMEFIAINNPRLIPQQAVTTATNIDDIEAYVLQRESESKINYLAAIDIPANERNKAMSDLRFMGITAGSMFPSLDGVCEELRECNFEQ